MEEAEFIPQQKTSLVEIIPQNDFTESDQGRRQLIRILCRSGLLPKLDNIYIRILADQPDEFLITPGRFLDIGTNLLNNPTISLFFLRYGLEWQTWYKAQKTTKKDPRICDLAAGIAAAKFYELNPPGEKKDIDRFYSEIVTIIFKPKFSKEGEELQLSASDFSKLKELHHLTAPKTKINEAWLALINTLAKPTEYLLMSGGDTRLNIESTYLLNKYGCRPFPRPEAFTFASSTATSISNTAFNHTENQREKLIRKAIKTGLYKSAETFSKEIKRRLKKALSLPKNSAIVLTPSGTDASLQLAGICQAAFQQDIVHILVASDETGSGVPMALQGRHFSELSAHGDQVSKEALVDGFREVSLYKIPLRDENGFLKDTKHIDQQVLETAEAALKQGKQPILHLMNQSKLGYSSPSKSGLETLQKKFGKKLLMAIDNSQLRLEKEEIKQYVNEGFPMIVTGSKFFTGPPFCGALIIPEDKQAEWGNLESHLPRGLENYSYKNNWPEGWHLAQNFKQGINYGTLMRWFAALIEIERYFETPLSLRHLGAEMFCNHVDTSIEQSPFLEHLPKLIRKNRFGERDDINRQRTIFPFFIKWQGKVLSYKQTRRLYVLLNRDLSNRLDDDSQLLTNLAKRACHIGQPVKVIYDGENLTGALRISLGARVISESWRSRDVSIFFQKIEEQMNQVNIIIRKIELILEHPEWLED